MDLWVVAAITGAGYAAKYLQNFSQEKDRVTGLMSTSSVSKKNNSPSLIPSFEENDEFSRKYAYRRPDQHLLSYEGNANLLDGRFSDTIEIASTSGYGGEYFDSYSEEFAVSARAAGRLRGHRRGQNSLGSRIIKLQYPRALNSLDSCAMAQIYEERSEMEDHVITPLLSPCVPALRPFVVTDGTQVISRPSFDSFHVQVRDDKKKVHSNAYPKMNEAVLGGIIQLPERGSGQCSKETNLMKANDQVRRLRSTVEMPNETQRSSQELLPSEVAFFCLGVSVGVMYSTLTDKREVTELKDILKQTENLVQDLQEELEMHRSLTVKELISSDGHTDLPHELESAIDDKKPMLVDLQSDLEVLMNCGVESCDIHKEPENIESMILIEAELEKELERLELNMKGSTAQAKSPQDDEELDADIVADLVQGELRADVLSRKPTSDPSRDGISSGSTTPCSPNQAVSPRDLSFRLHKVIQSRLEHRIVELEAALQKSYNRVSYLESEQGLSHIDASSFSSSRGSPIPIEPDYLMESHPEAERKTEHELPFVMNLSGEALDAYNEAFEELNQIKGSEMKPSSLFYVPMAMDEKVLTTRRISLEQREIFSFDEGDDEDNDDDDTSLLIKQIVEKTRQGSSAILHAHRAMVSIDSHEN